VRHKNSARPTRTDKGWFFAKMLPVTRDHCPNTRLAEPMFTRNPVHAALAGADRALGQEITGTPNPVIYLPVFTERDIAGYDSRCHQYQ